MRVKDIINVLKTQGKFETNPIIYESALYYHASILMNMGNFVKTDGKTINYYGLVLAGSGSGKDFAFDLVSEIFNLPEEAYTENILAGIEQNNKDKITGVYFNEETESLKENAPKSITLGLEGTKEGLFSICKAQSIGNFGSLNLTHGEFGDIITKSSELLSGLKELYDGKMSAKVIKSANVSGSHAGIAHEARGELMQLVKSGMFRRTYIIDLPSEILVRQKNPEDLEAIKVHLAAMTAGVGVHFMDNHEKAKSNLFVTEFPTTKEATDTIDKIYDDLLKKSNEDLTDEIKKAEVGALTMIENLAHIIAFIENKAAVEKHHVEDAYIFYERCRATTTETFTINHPYMIIYKILHNKSNLTISEMSKLDNAIPTAALKIKDEIAMLEEHCYVNNEKLIVNEGKVTRYSIEKLPENDNQAIIVSVSSEDKKHLAIDFKPFEVPFFGEGSSIETLVAHDEIQSFCTATFTPSAKATNGHRRAEDFIEGQNMMAFDIDEGMTIDDAIKKLEAYTYIIYTTKSNRIEKNGEVCDRFRIMMPTKQKFYVDAEQHKDLYNNVAELLDISVYDIQTRNVSRLWYTNKHTTLYKNKAKNIDISSCIPATETEKKFSQRLEEIDERYNDKSITGIYKWFFANTATGNRNDHLFRLGKFVKDLGEDYDMHITATNAMLDEPLSNLDVKHIINSVAR